MLGLIYLKEVGRFGLLLFLVLRPSLEDDYKLVDVIYQHDIFFAFIHHALSQVGRVFGALLLKGS